MLPVQVQLPFGETLPTPSELGWNIGTRTVRPEYLVTKPRHVHHVDEFDGWNPDDPDQKDGKHGFSFG